jgi:hypothetical protein
MRSENEAPHNGIVSFVFQPAGSKMFFSAAPRYTHGARFPVLHSVTGDGTGRDVDSLDFGLRHLEYTLIIDVIFACLKSCKHRAKKGCSL